MLGFIHSEIFRKFLSLVSEVTSEQIYDLSPFLKHCMFLDSFSDPHRSFNNLVAALQNNLPPNSTLLVMSTDSATTLNREVALIALVD